jgi:transposase-like protein
MRKNTKVAGDKTPIVAELPAACSDETLAVEFMERQRWGGKPICPHCASDAVYAMQGRDGKRSARFLWRCKSCEKQFTVRIGTVFEDSRIPLRHWCYGFWAACASKKGVSALQIKRMTGLSYKSALFMMHRIRWAMTDETNAPLQGTIEVDETYVGGKPRYHGKRNQGKMGRGTDKPPVVALVERGGMVRASVVTSVSGKNLKALIRASVDRRARIYTDDSNLYHGIGKEFYGGHATVNHTRKEYVRGDVHTNTVEGFFSILKRGLVGTFHAVSRKHFHRYLDEFTFKYSTRHLDDGERTIAAIQGAEGKRLTYKAQTG